MVIPLTIPVVIPNLIWEDINPELLYEIMDDASHYFTRIKSILSGNFRINNPYFEGTVPGGGYTFIGEYLVSILSIIGGSIRFGYFFQVIFFILFSFYIVEKILRAFVNKSAFGAFIFINTAFLLFPVWFLRPVAPSTSIILYFVILNSALKLLRNPEAWIYWYLTTFCIVLLWFSQPVVAIIGSISWAYMILFKLKFFKNYSYKKAILLIISLILSPIFWYLKLNYPYHSLKYETAVRTGLIDSRMPGGLQEVTISLAVISLVLLLSCAKIIKKDNGLKMLCLFLVFANLGGNHQILSGKHAFNSSYSRPIIYSICILISIILLGNLIKSFQINGYIMSVTLFLIIFFNYLHTYGVIDNLSKNRPLRLESQVSFISRLDKIDGILSDKVIIAPAPMGSLLPLYSRSKSLYANEGSLFYPVSNIEIIERALLNRYILNEKDLSKEDVKSLFNAYFNNLQARYSWNKKNQQEFIKFELDRLFQQALSIEKTISSNSTFFLRKYSVDGVIYFSNGVIASSNLCEPLVKGEIYSFCRFRLD